MPDSGATLLDAIVEISQGLEKRQEDRAAMVVLTTENTEFSTRHYSEVLEGLAKGGAMMHTVVLTSPSGSSLNDAARNRASVLDRGPRESGGTRADVLASQAFEVKLKELAAILKSQHRVVVCAAATVDPAAEDRDYVRQGRRRGQRRPRARPGGQIDAQPPTPCDCRRHRRLAVG